MAPINFVIERMAPRAITAFKKLKTFITISKLKADSSKNLR